MIIHTVFWTECSLLDGTKSMHLLQPLLPLELLFHCRTIKSPSVSWGNVLLVFSAYPIYIKSIKVNWMEDIMMSPCQKAVFNSLHHFFSSMFIPWLMTLMDWALLTFQTSRPPTPPSSFLTLPSQSLCLHSSAIHCWMIGYSLYNGLFLIYISWNLFLSTTSLFF